MKKAKRGRPPSDSQRDHQVAVWLNEEELKSVQEAAEKIGLPLSAYARSILLAHIGAAR